MTQPPALSAVNADDIEAMEEAPQFGEFLAHVRLHRRGAAKIFGAILAAALVIAALIPPRFQAAATLAVLPAPEFTVRQDAGSRALSTSALAMDQIMKAETSILDSDELHAATLASIGLGRIYPSLDPAIPKPFLLRALHAVASVILSPWRVTPANPQADRQDRALARFADDLLVLPAKDGNVITLTFRHRDGGVAAQAINTLLARYADRRSRLYNDPQLAVVRQQIDTSARVVAQADAALAAFKAAHTITDYGAERDLLIRRQSGTTQALAEAAANAAEYKARLIALNVQIARLPPTISLYTETDADTRVQALDAALVDLRTQLAAASTQYRDTSRKVGDLRRRIAMAEHDRRRMVGNPTPSVARTGRTPALDPLLLERAHAAAEAAAASARAGALGRELDAETAALARLNQEETALADLTRRREAAADGFAAASHVQDEQRMVEAEDALRLANVRVIQPARAPQRPEPTALLTVLAGFILGAFASIAWLFAGFAINPTFLTPEGLTHATGLPVLGVFQAEMAE